MEKPQENGGREEAVPPGEKDPCLAEEGDAPDVKDGDSNNKKKKRSKESEGSKMPVMKRVREKTGLPNLWIIIVGVLLLLLLILFVCIVVLAACWPSLPHHRQAEVCNTAACLRASAEMIPKMNMSSDPCEDFWGFACGGWTEKNPVPVTKSKWNENEELAFRSRERIRSLISTLPHPTRVDSFHWKIKYFYDSCMALGNIEIDKAKPLRKIITELGGWHVLREFSVYSWDFQRVIKLLHAQYGVSPFFKISVIVDGRNPDKNIIQISPSGLGLPDRSYYYRHPDGKVVTAYKRYLKDIVVLLGATTPDASNFAEEMFHFEKRIAEITPDPKELLDPISNYKKMTVEKLSTNSPSVPWLELLMAYFPDANIQDSTELLIPSEQYLRKISTIISTTDRSALNNYVVWSFASAYLPYLSEEYRAIVNLYRREMTGAQEPLKRWEMCVMTIQKYMGFAATALMDRNMKEKKENELVLEDIYDNIRKTVKESIAHSSQYAPDLESYAIEKLHSMSLQVGYPDFMLEDKYLEDYYAIFHIQKNDFFRNIQYGVEFLKRSKERRYINPTKESGWMEALLRNKVSYIPTANKVVIPRHIIVAPFYHRGYPASVLYGSIGVKIADALVSGVSQWEALYDADGILLKEEDMRINKTNDAISSAKRCLVHSLMRKRLAIEEVIEKTSRSTVVHIAAVKQSHGALDKILSEAPDVHQPGMEIYESDALFFLAYSQTLCSLSTLQQHDIDKTVSFDLDNMEKLKATLIQLKQFSDAFQCYSGSVYYASETCEEIL